MTDHRSKQFSILTSLAFALAVFTGFAGVARCFVQSPQSKSDQYLQMSVNAMANDADLALSAALEAARLNPVSTKAWHHLSIMLQQTGDDIAARQALQIAQRLQHNPSESLPLYAMPAELRLSLLATGNGDF